MKIRIKGRTSNANPPAGGDLTEREIAINEVSGKLYARGTFPFVLEGKGSVLLDEDVGIFSIAGVESTIMYSDDSPEDNDRTYLLLQSQIEEPLQLLSITYKLEEGALTGASIKKRKHNLPETEGSGLITIATFNINDTLQTLDIFDDQWLNKEDPDVNVLEGIIENGDGLIFDTGIGADPVKLTLQIMYKIRSPEVPIFVPEPEE